MPMCQTTQWRRAWRHTRDDVTSRVTSSVHLFDVISASVWPGFQEKCQLLATRPMAGHEFQYKLCKDQQISPFKLRGRFCSFSAGGFIWDSWVHMLNFITLRPRCEAWERFPIYARQTWLPWKPIGPLTLCTCPPPSLQVWCPSACKHQRSRLTKFNYDFLVKCGLKACFSCFHDNRVGISWRQYFSCHPRPKTHPLAKTQSKSDWNWRKIKDSDIRVLYKR